MQRIANTAVAAMQEHGSEALEAALADVSSADIARAQDLMLKKNMPQAALMMLQQRMQTKLLEEHIDEQRSIATAQDALARKVYWLNWILVVLAALTALAALPDGCAKVADYRDRAAWGSWVESSPESR